MIGRGPATTEKKLSTPGYPMDGLGLSIAGLAHRLHVDASLVSKWHSGSCHPNIESVHFEEIYAMPLEQDGTALDDALYSLVLLKDSEDSPDTAVLLRRVLIDRYFTIPRAFTPRIGAVRTAETAIYTSGEGRRQTVPGLLDMTEAMEIPGEMLYVDSGQSRWPLEDPVYAQEWAGWTPGLLDRGFIFRATLHFSVSVDRFVSFFHLCSPLILHRSAHWFYHRYYDEDVYWLSFFVLEHAMSVLGVPMSTEQTFTMVYTDAYSILQHKSTFHMVLTGCRPMFMDLSIDVGWEAASRLSSSVHQGERLLSYLPVPAFMTVEGTLLNDILQGDEATGRAASRCREADRLLGAMTERHLAAGEEVIQILQLDETQRRIRTCYIGTSLSLIRKKQVVIFPIHCARKLEELAGRMERYPFYRLFLADDTDHICLPGINCWCHGTPWVAQMGAYGFRVCHEPTLSGAIYITLEQGWRRVPPGRKDPATVLSVLRSLIIYTKNCIS